MKSAVVLSGEALPGRSHRAWCRERFETWKREKKMQASLSVLSSPETTKFTDGFRGFWGPTFTLTSFFTLHDPLVIARFLKACVAGCFCQDNCNNGRSSGPYPPEQIQL
ncbi:MAG: hypothetical protein FRX49_05695 [Trebouxia sp. A1-2]|nr:MAG: hypothetical protein FRX49_05695 [Trebouxia sp. A1-2]